MKEYNVYVDITYSATISVQAETREEAVRKAEELVNISPQDYMHWAGFVGAGAYDCEESHPYGEDS